MRKFLVALALLLAIFLVITRFAEVQKIAETFQSGDWRFLLLALIVQVLWLFNVGASYQAIYQILGIQGQLPHMAVLSAAASFANVVAPSGGVSAIAVFIADARSHKYSPARATVAGALFVLFDYVGFLGILTLGLIVLFRRNHLNWPEIIASIILIGIALVLAILLYLGTRSARELGHVLAWMARQVNRILRPFLHREYLSEERAHTFAHDAADGVRAIKDQPQKMIRPILFALSNKALLITVLLLIFLAFKVPFSIGTLVAGFSLGYLFMIVSPTPLGIGVVEGIMTLSLNTLMVPLEAAAVIVLAYRGFTFWVPFFFGMVGFHRLGKVETFFQTEDGF